MVFDGRVAVELKHFIPSYTVSHLQMITIISVRG